MILPIALLPSKLCSILGSKNWLSLTMALRRLKSARSGYEWSNMPRTRDIKMSEVDDTSLIPC